MPDRVLPEQSGYRVFLSAREDPHHFAGWCLLKKISRLFKGFPGLFLALFLAAGPSLALASSPTPSLPRLTSLVARGSTATLVLQIPSTPSGVTLYLSLDGDRLMGRKIVPGAALSVCVGHLSPGLHHLGYQTARADHIVLIDPVIFPVTIPGGSPVRCPGEGPSGVKD